MEITTISDKSYKKVVTVNYIPTKAELYFYYSGTNAGLTPDNPYNTRSGSISKIEFIIEKGTL